MEKFFVKFAVISVVMGLVGCGSGGDSSEKEDVSTSSSEKNHLESKVQLYPSRSKKERRISDGPIFENPSTSVSKETINRYSLSK